MAQTSMPFSLSDIKRLQTHIPEALWFSNGGHYFECSYHRAYPQTYCFNEGDHTVNDQMNLIGVNIKLFARHRLLPGGSFFPELIFQLIITQARMHRGKRKKKRKKERSNQRFLTSVKGQQYTRRANISCLALSAPTFRFR